MTEHTKEPWKIGSSPAGKSVVFLVGDEPEHTLGPDENWIDCNTEANARRIVACVNYCAGYDTVGMETAASAGRTAKVSNDYVYAELTKLSGEVDKLQSQRDQLLAALENFMLAAEHGGSKWKKSSTKQARAAIAAVKGGAA